MMTLRTAMLLTALLSPVPGLAGSSHCYAIKDADLKNQCLAITKNSISRCYAIKDNDLKNGCLAQVGGQKNRCYSIKDNDLKHRCLAGFQPR